MSLGGPIRFDIPEYNFDFDVYQDGKIMDVITIGADTEDEAYKALNKWLQEGQTAILTAQEPND